jgi:hypothetical protein
MHRPSIATQMEINPEVASREMLTREHHFLSNLVHFIGMCSD